MKLVKEQVEREVLIIVHSQIRVNDVDGIRWHVNSRIIAITIEHIMLHVSWAVVNEIS